MHATRKNTAATWIKELAPECQFTLRSIQRKLVVNNIPLEFDSMLKKTVKIGIMITYLPLSVHLFTMLSEEMLSEEMLSEDAKWRNG